MVLALGDNEWTDCHRIKAGEFQPLERLAKLREIFFSKPGTSLGQKPMQVTSQAREIDGGLAEHLIWIKNSVVFSSLHIVGSNNGLKAFEVGSKAERTEADDLEVASREKLALNWLDKTFNEAKRSDASGVFILIHANPGLEKVPADRLGFESFLSKLETLSKEFKRPVVLAHGDSHYFRVDKPTLASGEFISNFTRVETFGPDHLHWIEILVNPNDQNVFTFKPRLVDGN